MTSWTPIAVDDHGSGLYESADGARAFRDMENPEDRWMRTMAEGYERECEERERAEDMERLILSERERWAEEDDEWPWRRREKPCGLMYGVEARDDA